MAKNARWKKFRNFLLATTSVFALVGSGTGVSSTSVKENIQPTNDSIPQLVVNNPVQTITFRNDTLYQGTSTLLYYLMDNITRNVMDKRQSYRMQLPYFAHENKHHQNEKVPTPTGLRSYRFAYKYSPSQYAVLCMFDEITANLVAIETAAFEYITAEKQEDVIKKYENTYMKFYFDAIKEGRIEPLKLMDIEYIKTHRHKLEEYRSFMANETQNMWESRFRGHYSPAQYNMVLRYINNVGLFPASRGNFNFVANHMWTIGGVKFYPYLDHIVEPYDVRIKLFDAMAYVKSFVKDRKTTSSIVKNISDNFKYLSTFSYDQQELALQHLFIAAKMKSALQNVDVKQLQAHPQYIAATYHKTMYELSHDLTFHIFVKNNAHIGESTKLYPVLHNAQKEQSLSWRHEAETLDAATKAKLKLLYRFHGLDLTAMIPDFDMTAVPTAPMSFFETQFNRLMYGDDSYEFNMSLTQLTEMQKLEKIQPEPSSAIMSVHTVAAPAKPRRLSLDMYMNVLDFREPILEPEAMTDEAMAQITQMFREFNNIPSSFKNCDFNAKEQYEQEHGVTYFTDAEYPFQPTQLHKNSNKSKAQSSLTLSQVRKSQKQK